MGDGQTEQSNIEVERSMVPGVPDSSPPSEAVGEDQKINVDQYYQADLDRIKIAKLHGEAKALETITKVAEESRKMPRRQVVERSVRQDFGEKLRRTTLKVQGKVEGIRDIDKFDQVVDYLESTVVGIEQRRVKIPVEMKMEEVQKVADEWVSKGWDAHPALLHRGYNERDSYLPIIRDVPFQVGNEQIKGLRSFVSRVENPVGLARKLVGLGFRFDPETLGDREKMERLTKFLESPKAGDVLEKMGGVSGWGDKWVDENGLIEYFTVFANDDASRDRLSPANLEKIDKLSTAIGIKLEKHNFDDLLSIVEDEDSFEFTVFLADAAGNKGATFGDVPLLKNIQKLKQEMLFEPTLELIRCGVSIASTEDKRCDFNSLVAESGLTGLEDRQSKMFDYLRGVVARPEVRSILISDDKKDFLSMISDRTGEPVPYWALKKIEDEFGNDETKRKNAAYFLGVLERSGITKKKISAINFSELGGIASSENKMSTFVDRGFLTFLDQLTADTGYTPELRDFVSGSVSRLASIYNDHGSRGILLNESVRVAIRSLGGKIAMDRIQYYETLGEIPNVSMAIEVCRKLGVDLSEATPSVGDLEIICGEGGILARLESTEMAAFVGELKEKFGWVASTSELLHVVQLFDDHIVGDRLALPESVEYVKRVFQRGAPTLAEIKGVTEMDSGKRDVLLRLVERYRYIPTFGYLSRSNEDQSRMLSRLVEDPDFRKAVFSDRVGRVFDGLRKIDYDRILLGDIEELIKAPEDLVEYIADFKMRYGYRFNINDVKSLIRLSVNRDGTRQLCDSLKEIGCVFEHESMVNIVRLLPYSGSFGQTVAMLKEELGYKFRIDTLTPLEHVLGSGINRESVIRLRSAYERYVTDRDPRFGVEAIELASNIERNLELLGGLEKYGYKFKISDGNAFKDFFGEGNGEKILGVLEALASKGPHMFMLDAMPSYLRLSNIDNMGDKLASMTSVDLEKLRTPDDMRLFVALGAEPEVFRHAKKLLAEEYFVNIRDAAIRLESFKTKVNSGLIPDEVLSKIFILSRKPTEFDRLALRYSINLEIAGVVKNKDWDKFILNIPTYEEADKLLMEKMVDTALAVVYADTPPEEMRLKKALIANLAEMNKEFAEKLEIGCRSVGIYASKYPSDTSRFKVLTDAIRMSIELNQEGDPAKYAENRTEASRPQFERLFEGAGPGVREIALSSWSDLSNSRALRIVGSEVSDDDITIGRINKVRDVARYDLRDHLQVLMNEKLKKLEEEQTEKPGGFASELLSLNARCIEVGGPNYVQDSSEAVINFLDQQILSMKHNLGDGSVDKNIKAETGKRLGVYQALNEVLRTNLRLTKIEAVRGKIETGLLSGINEDKGVLRAALKRLKILDAERMSQDQGLNVLERDVIHDLRGIDEAMAEEKIFDQVDLVTESVVDFTSLARAPEMTQSCQRLTEVTGHNQAAYSRLLDGIDQMVGVSEVDGGNKRLVARTFAELSKVKLRGQDDERIVVLIDRLYVDPQRQYITNRLSDEVILHMAERLTQVPGASILLSSLRFNPDSDILKRLETLGFRARVVAGEYYINESNVKFGKYYDSLGGINMVDKPSWTGFHDFLILEKT